MISENSEDLNGNAKIIQENNNTDKPLTIIGLRPILSDNDPVIGERIM